MQVAILADTHAGTRNNSTVFMQHQIAFFENVFFPYVEAHNIKHMIHLGDVFDRRKDTNTYALHQWDEKVFCRWDSWFHESHIIIGNHDTYFKNTNSVNTPEKILSQYKKFRFYANPTDLNLFGVPTLILPWICEENSQASLDLMQSSEADLVLGHLEIIGFPMFRGIENLDKGFDAGVFTRFKKVLSGHFHLKSHQRNINYLGSPYATTWAEASETKGFHIIDTETLKLKFVENPENPFVHINYDESSSNNVPSVKNKIVRVLISQKGSETAFLKFLEKIEAQSPAEVNVQEQLPSTKINEAVDEHMDLFSLMDLYVNSLDFESPKSELKTLLRDLYNEAVSLHDISE